ncbi:hypothetical protein BT96DRAFT_996818 [Gymnopus androsaceus JB14]|uniref:Uncharacterized protein n=1 Tax=Gymnopus androsaceus JB14 TaxID=1447944 RepID=A0A6A4HF29_9AGAR|nr:hypothetical protein BT96DRAFT_996818 [Gymnopus androsaceus JB14]
MSNVHKLAVGGFLSDFVEFTIDLLLEIGFRVVYAMFSPLSPLSCVEPTIDLSLKIGFCIIIYAMFSPLSLLSCIKLTNDLSLKIRFRVIYAMFSPSPLPCKDLLYVILHVFRLHAVVLPMKSLFLACQTYSLIALLLAAEAVTLISSSSVKHVSFCRIVAGLVALDVCCI